jgi:hypothetical protein
MLKIKIHNEKMDSIFKNFVISYSVFYYLLVRIILLSHTTIHTFRYIVVK